jgi:hypothetical protein
MTRSEVLSCAHWSIRLLSLLLPLCTSAADPGRIEVGATWHVRVDGGTSVQCNGKANAAYPGSGVGRNCAWSSPMIALPPDGASARLNGGDTLIIHTGQYMIGFGAPGAEACDRGSAWDCTLGPIPSGSDASRPTRILGESADASCRAAPQLWGTEHAHHVLSLAGTQHAQVQCLEITDHAGCVESHRGGLACKRDLFPFGPWAAIGIYAADSSDVSLMDLNIHGLAHSGIQAGRLRDWTLTRVRIAANGWAGWDGDLGANTSANTGKMSWSNVLVEWNGCGETYPQQQPAGCWGESAGGYGDGVGTASTGGDWVIRDSTFRYNTQDGLDLLYHDRGGSITLNRVWAEGNAGNQLKLKGNASITNAVALGNCGFFDGKAFTYDVGACRAAGDAVVLAATTPHDFLSVTNSTIVSQGNVVILTTGPRGSSLVLRNNILVGMPNFASPDRNSADTYVQDGIEVDDGWNLKQDLRHAKCGTPGTICGESGLLVVGRDRFDPGLKPGSAARASGLPPGGVIPSDDYYGRGRPSGRAADRGAVQMP